MILGIYWFRENWKQHKLSDGWWLFIHSEEQMCLKCVKDGNFCDPGGANIIPWPHLPWKGVPKVAIKLESPKEMIELANFFE